MLALTACILLPFAISGCDMYEVRSAWPKKDIHIDGVDGGSEWEGGRYVLEEKNITIGVMNDGESIYLRLSTRDRTLQRQIVCAGCTVWFDPDGGRGKEFGIFFPLGLQTARVTPDDDSESEDTNTPEERMTGILNSMQHSIGIIGPGNRDRKLVGVDAAGKYGIFARVADTNGNLVYELEVPLLRTDDTPFAVAESPVSTVGIGIQTSRLARQSPGGVYERGGLGGPRGGMGRRGRPAAEQPRDPLNMWMKTTLATKG